MSADEPTFDVEELPEPDRRYPVIVTIHHEHVLWVDGESTKDALNNLKNHGAWYELVDDQETRSSSWEEMRSPGDDFHSWDWKTVYEGDYFGAYQGIECNDHVETHKHMLLMAKRAEEKAACKAARHPELQIYDHCAEPYCPTCGYLKTAVLVADLRGGEVGG